MVSRATRRPQQSLPFTQWGEKSGCRGRDADPRRGGLPHEGGPGGGEGVGLVDEVAEGALQGQGFDGEGAGGGGLKSGDWESRAEMGIKLTGLNRKSEMRI